MLLVDDVMTTGASLHAAAQALAQAGLLGLAIDEEHGGMGFGFFSLCTLCEEVGRHVAPLPVIPRMVTSVETESV